MSANEYRILGVAYVIAGIWLFFFFLFRIVISIVLIATHIWIPPGAVLGFFLIFVIIIVIWVGSLVLALFGLVLVFRGGELVAQVSGVLFFFLLICYLGVLFSPLMVIRG